MRRRTIFLAAGLLAYVFGATVRAYLRYPDCDERNVGCRILVVAEYGQTALRHPYLAIDYLVWNTHIE